MGSIIKPNDFTKFALEHNKIEVNYYKHKKIILSNGEERLTFEPPIIIECIFHLNKLDYKNQNEGDVITSAGYIMTAPDIEINKNDLVEFDKDKYIIFNVIKRGPSGDTHFYTYAEFNLYENGDY